MPAVKPRLRNVIETAEAYVRTHDRPPVYYNIETKSSPDGDSILHPPPEAFTRLLYDVLVETGIRDRSTLQSFDIRTLQAARRLDPDLSLSLLIAAPMAQSLDAQLDALGFVPDVYSPDYHLVDAPLVEAVHQKGMRLIPWTVNTLDAMRALRALGVDGLITDYPDLGKTLLTDSGP
jgi:glycerophosphoryl diester phosphodiesterase